MTDTLAQPDGQHPEVARLAQDVQELLATVERLEKRLRALEATQLPPPLDRAEITEELAALAPATSTLLEAVTLSGRTCLVLGGAYLLRALVEGGTVGPLGGLTGGLLYATLWFVLADRAAARGRDASAGFHGLAAAMIGFPLLWEGTLRFGVLPSALSAALLAAFAALGGGIAWYRSHRALAWIVAAFGFVAVFALLFRSHVVEPFAVALLLLAAGAGFLAERRGWPGLAWFAAAVVDLALLFLFVLAAGPRQVEWLDAQHVVVIGVATVLCWLGWIGVRFVLRDALPRLHEVVHTAVLLLVVVEGSALVLEGTPGRLVLGLGALAWGAAGYWIAYARVWPRHGAGPRLLFFVTAGLYLMLEGVRFVAPPLPAVVAWSVLGLLVGWVGTRWDRSSLEAHAAAYVTVAAVASGALAGGAAAFFGGLPTRPGPAWLTSTLLATAAYLVLLLGRSTAGRPAVKLAPRLVVLSVVLAGLDGAIVALAAGLLAAGEAVDPGSLASLRTAVLAVSALGLALAGRSSACRELSWLVYPVLGLGAVKFVLQDLPQGRPSTLFISLVLIGGAMVAVPFLRRRVDPAAPSVS